MLKKVWKLFISVRLTIVLLIVLSAVCVIGTVVPQNGAEQDYQRLYSPSTYGLLKSMGFTDMYHCWWFMAALGLFTLNLAACSLNRLSGIRRLLQPPPQTPTEQQLQAMGNVKKFNIKKAGPGMADALANAVGQFLAAPAVTRQDGKTYIVAEKGRLSYLGFYLTHIGMITVIAGVLLGTIGFQGYMNINEGETQSTVTLKNSTQPEDLGFSLRCDKFEVSYYDKGMPKDYKSWLTVVEDGKDVLKKVIEVNDPLIYKGIYFYQSSYGQSAGEGGEVLVRIGPAGSKQAREYRVRPKQRFALAGTQDEAVVDTVLPDFAMDNGKFFSRSDEPNNPAASVVIFRSGKELESLWTFMKFPDFHRKQDAAYDVQLVQLYTSYYTGLQVTRDPGVNVVWLGCIFLIAGICMAFFMSHRRVYLVFEEKDGGLRALLAGSASKNRQAFVAELNGLFEQLKSLEKQS
jgi:cytochrome c biogenesis protein